MNKKLWLLALPAILCSGIARADVVTFENGDTGPFSYDAGQVYVFDASDEDARTGYGQTLGQTAGSWLATNLYEYDRKQYTPSVFDYVGGDSFRLESLVLASAYGTQTLTIVGYEDDVQKYVMDVATSLTPQTVVFDDWIGIDRFSVALTGDFVADAVLKAEKVGNGGYWALDNVVYQPVPEPGTYAMLLAGLAVVGSVARRRRAFGRA